MQGTNTKQQITDEFGISCWALNRWLKKAGNFGSRIYNVWFTPDIPGSLGAIKIMNLK